MEIHIQPTKLVTYINLLRISYTKERHKLHLHKNDSVVRRKTRKSELCQGYAIGKIS